MKTLLLCSGGADSSTLLYKLYNEGADKIHCVFVHYGSRHNEREYRAFLSVISYINDTDRISTQKIHIDFNAFGITSALMQGSEIPIPKEGHNDVSITKTVVPLRNGIMLCIASAIAESMDYEMRCLGTQERLTMSIANRLQEITKSERGVICRISARHMCMEMRGVETPGIITVTLAGTGVFNSDSTDYRDARKEFLELI